ncbi:hypothetical protein [Streptomyces sp. NPDC046727]|uniref:hypothetical protein n=1 Tax=Streptomyces sp. NPDC046727 TaxID=3155373 RepID=UPI0033E4799B
MGERHSGDGLPGRRRAHPDGTVAAPERADASGGVFELESRLGAALRAGKVDPEAERSAVAAFRAAREAGAHDARTRARDDWRPGRPGRARRPLRTTLSLVLASLTMGGVAVAAIGSARSGTDDGPTATRSPRPSASAPAAPAGPAADGREAGPADTGSAGRSAHPAGGPATARDTLAHCRTYVRAGDRGGALEATAWQRLVTAAGGTGKVAAYCAARLAHAPGKNTDKPDNSGDGGRSANEGGGKGTPTGGASTGGTSNGGNPTGGDPADGNATGGNPAAGKSSGGKR